MIALVRILQLIRPQLTSQEILAVVNDMEAYIMCLYKIDPSNSAWVNICKRALKFCGSVQKQHPLVYASLELGHSWNDVIGKMLNATPVGSPVLTT